MNTNNFKTEARVLLNEVKEQYEKQLNESIGSIFSKHDTQHLLSVWTNTLFNNLMSLATRSNEDEDNKSRFDIEGIEDRILTTLETACDDVDAEECFEADDFEFDIDRSGYVSVDNYQSRVNKRELYESLKSYIRDEFDTIKDELKQAEQLVGIVTPEGSAFVEVVNNVDETKLV